MRNGTQAACGRDHLDRRLAALRSPAARPRTTGDTRPVRSADAEREEALNTPTDLTFWTWVPDIQDQVDMFMEEYPAINVTVENVGQGLDHYPRCAPPRGRERRSRRGPARVPVHLVVRPDRRAARSHAVRCGRHRGRLRAWVWKQVVSNDQVLAIPQDSGPMGNLYREDIMTAAGVTEPPATWADYKTAAEAVGANTDSYISNMAPGQGAGWSGCCGRRASSRSAMTARRVSRST